MTPNHARILFKHFIFFSHITSKWALTTSKGTSSLSERTLKSLFKAGHVLYSKSYIAPDYFSVHLTKSAEALMVDELIRRNEGG